MSQRTSRVLAFTALLLLLAASVAAQVLDNVQFDSSKDRLTLFYSDEVARIIHVWEDKSRTRSLDEMREEVERITGTHGLPVTSQGLEVWIRFKDNPHRHEPELKTLGVRIDDHYAVVDNYVQAFVPYESLLKLSSLSSVLRVSLPPLGVPTTITSEGLARVHASNYLNQGYRGSGVKVAVVDLGFVNYQQLLGSELPSNVVVRSFYNDTSGNGDITGGGNPGNIHGTACAEIVHDMAPDATLYLVNYNTAGDLSAAVDYLIAQGVKVVSHSVGFFNTSFYSGAGPISSVVSHARANGITWVNAAGNQGQRHWEGYFIDTNGNSWNDFSSGDETINITLSAGQAINIFLTWNDWASANNDYDLYLFYQQADGTLAQVASSRNYQTGLFGSQPTEQFSYTPPQAGLYHIAIRRPFSASMNLRFELFVTGVDLDEYRVTSTSLIDPAPSSDSFTVGAMGYNLNTIESFSSRGPSTAGVTKPDITGPDAVSTYTYGSPFFGTSAATPHVAGAAADVLSKTPTMTVSQVAGFLSSNAIDFGSVGKDNVYGSGMLNLPGQPLSVTWTTPPPSSIVAGQQFTVSWAATGSPTHINVHWNPTDPTASGCCLGPDNSTNNSTLSPTTSPVTLTAPILNSDGSSITSAVTTKYVVHVHDASGTTAYSSIVPVTIYPNIGDVTPPDTTITSGPSGTVGSSSVGFTWTGNDNVTPSGSLVYAYRLAPRDSSFSSFGTATSQTYSGLSNGTYTFYVKARDQAGNEDPTPAARTFTVNISAVFPSATTLAASNVSTSTAFLNSTVNPNGSDTLVSFEYGTTTSYTSSTSPIAIGAGLASIPVSASIVNLACETVYNFRVKATNVAGTTFGLNQNFVTGGCGGGGGDTQLFDGQSVSDSITSQSSQADWKYYYIVVPDGLARLDVSLTDLSDDVDLYVNPLSKPDLGTFACRPYYGGTASEQCSINNPTPGVWWVGVNNYAVGSINYKVTASFATSLGNYYTLPPCRIVDTRLTNGAISGRSGLALQVVGLCGIPVTATAVALNVTVTRPTGPGYLSVYSELGVPPSTAAVTFARGQTLSNNAIVGLVSPNGVVAVFSGTSGGDFVDYIIDVSGYFD